MVSAVAPPRPLTDDERAEARRGNRSVANVVQTLAFRELAERFAVDWREQAAAPAPPLLSRAFILRAEAYEARAHELAAGGAER